MSSVTSRVQVSQMTSDQRYSRGNFCPGLAVLLGEKLWRAMIVDFKQALIKIAW